MIARVRVLRSWRETPTTHAVRFEKPPGFTFRPVQFCGLELDTDEGGIEYPMSLACSPTRDHLEFGARIVSGTPWKRAFAALREGDDAEVDGAYGHFVLDESRPAVLVAGGIGITPLKGMLQYVVDRGLDLPVRLLYGNRSADEIAYRDELDALANEAKDARVVHTLTRPAPGTWDGRTGRIDRALLAEAADGLREPVFYVCGVPAMVEDMVATALDLGVPESRVRYEGFAGY